MSSKDAKPVLAEWLKKKGSKFGFWHKRFCSIVDNCLVISKTESPKDVERKIEIGDNTKIEIIEDERPPRFIVIAGDERPICLAHESLDTIVNWTGVLRNLTLQTPGLSMDNFEIVSTLGRGFYGKVMLCKKKGTEEYYAIKTVHKNRLVKANKVHTIFTERNVLMRARHPFIVNIAFAFQSDSKVYLGLEYASGGELFHHLQRRGTIPIAEVRLYIAELSLAINYLHNLNVIYRDLKPENVLLDAQGHVKLTDFGLAKKLDTSGETGTFCGTSEYLAPEIISRRPYGPKIDWWAIGVLTYELLYGQTPFFDKNKARMFQAIRNEKPKFPRRADEATVDFITMLLEKDPERRADFDRIKGHPFFKGLDFEKVLRREIKPAFVPPSNGIITANFDTEFTMENPQDSLATPTPMARDEFKGFSFAGVPDGSSSSDGEGEEMPAMPPSDLQPTTM